MKEMRSAAEASALGTDEILFYGFVPRDLPRWKPRALTIVEALLAELGNVKPDIADVVAEVYLARNEVDAALKRCIENDGQYEPSFVLMKRVCWLVDATNRALTVLDKAARIGRSDQAIINNLQAVLRSFLEWAKPHFGYDGAGYCGDESA